jgi:Kef-type K+ transport system membrane component KefB
MSTSLTLVLVVVVAYLAAHVAFDRLAQRFLIVSGVEYLVLGLLLGPQVSGILSAETVRDFAPLTMLALGWVGAIIGTQFYLPELIRLPSALFKVAFAEAAATLLLVTGLLAAAMMWLFDITLAIAVVPSLALGAVATASAPTGIEVVARALGRRRSAALRQLQVAVAVDALVAIAAMGLLACIGRPLSGGPIRPLTATEWAVLSLGVGLVGGALFHLFVGAERKVDRLFISLGGAVILTAGAAAYLGISVLLPAMVVGATLVNTSRNRDEIAATLHAAERPFYFVLLIFAGAAWTPSSRAWLVPVVLFLLARAAAKMGGARLAARMNGVLPALGPHWGRALLGHGGLALALAFDYRQHHGAFLPSIVFTAAIASVLLTDLSSARLVKSVLEPVLEREQKAVSREQGAGSSEQQLPTT